MDPFLAMMGQSPDEKQSALMAQMLRGQSGLGARLSTSTIQPVQRQGLAMQDMAQGQAQSIGQAKYRNDLIEEQAKAREARVLTAALAAKEKEGKKQYKLSDSAAKEFSKDIKRQGVVTNLVSRFKDDFAGELPWVGDVKNWSANRGVGTEAMKAQSEWWSDWKKFYENPERNALFGSALTDGEQRQWRAASISPDMDAEQIRSRLKTQELLNRKAAAYEAKSLAMRGHEDFAREMSIAANALPPEAFEDLDAYMADITRQLEKRVYPNQKPSLDELSLEELMRMREEM